MGATTSAPPVLGVIADDADDGSELPTALVATTVKVTDVDVDNPLNVHTVAPVVWQVSPDEAVTV